jgi:hypothetical protein
MARNPASSIQGGSELGRKPIKRMVRKRALERWETEIETCEVTPQAIWLIAKSLSKRGGPKAPTAIYGHLGPTFYPNEKSSVIAN